MDPLSQGLLGASLAQSGAAPRETRLAATVGFAAGLLADADVLIRSGEDPLLTLEYHRHFTHALLFVPIGALIAALLLWPFLRNRLPFARLYLFALLGYSLSGFLDACTSYGTHLLWPFSDERSAFSIISIIDPVFTLLLLTGALAGFMKRSSRPAAVGLLLAGCYLLVGVLQHQRARSAAEELAADRGHSIERLAVKPTLGNLLLWRSIYQNDEHFHVDAIRVGLGPGYRFYSGGTAERFHQARHLPDVPGDSTLARDLARFERFSDGYVTWHPSRENVLGDIRYANDPTRLEPLWGIELDPRAPEQHAHFTFYRDLSGDNRERFLSMVLGRTPD